MSQQINAPTSNATPSDWSHIGQLDLIIRTALSGVRTAIPVQVMSVTNNGGVSPIGTVSLKPLVQGKDGAGNAVPHGTIFNCPYMRIQGGENAIILDPQVGDIGLGVVCDRDISAVQNSRAEAPPGSSRKNDMSDMVYLMTIISATTPTQYVQFNATGITITSPQKVIINANEVDVNATTSANVTAPAINLRANGQTLLSLVTSTFQALFNGHTHPVAGSQTTAPNQQMNSSHLTSTVKGA